MEIKKLNTVLGNAFSLRITFVDGKVMTFGPFTKDEEAIELVQRLEKEEELENQKKGKTLSPFDYINSFYMGVNPFDNMNTGDFEVNMKSYSQFIINKAMTMNEENTFTAYSIGSIQKLNNYAHAAYWTNCAIKPRVFSKWIKEEAKDKKKQEKIDELSSELGISKTRAEEYINTLAIISNET